MEPNSPTFLFWVVALSIGGFLILFPLIWCSVVWLISQIGAWGRLAQRYSAGDRPVSGDCHRRVSGRIGVTRYNGVLTLHLNQDGFFMEVMPLFRIGHPRLFIPWSEVTARTHQRIFWMEMERLTIGAPVVATLSLPSRVIRGQPKPPPLSR